MGFHVGPAFEAPIGFIAEQIPKRLRCRGRDTVSEFAERRVRVDRDNPVIGTEFGEYRRNARGDRRFAGATFTDEYPDSVAVPAQQAPDRLHILAEFFFIRRQPRINQPPSGLQQRVAPAARRLRLGRRGQGLRAEPIQQR